MEFGNPIVGSEDLIRSAIKSPDFNTDLESGNVTGWRIARDGSATFYNLIIGSTNFNIDENGNAVFQSVSATDITLDGEDLQTVLDSKAEGIQAIVTLSGEGNGYNGTSLKFGQIVIPNFDATRVYAIGGSGVHFSKQLITGYTRLTLRAYLNWDADATTSNTQLVEYQYLSDSGSASDWILSWLHPWQDTSPGGTDAHISWYFTTNVNNVNGLHCVGTDGADGGTPGSRLFAMDMGKSIGYSDYDLGSGTPPVQQYTKTYSCNGSASFQSDGDNRGVSEAYQGYYSGTNGNQFSLLAFPYATIASDLAGSTINKVELYLNNNHFYFNAGGDALIGAHNLTSVSGDHSSSVVIHDRINTPHYDLGQAKWTTISNLIGEEFRDGNVKGIALGPASSNSNADYGYFAGNGQSGEPQLRITYTK